MDENRQEPVQLDGIIKARKAENPDFEADLLIQHAGIAPSKNGHPLGHNVRVPIDQLRRTEEKKRNGRKLSVSENTLLIASHWLNPDQIANYPRLELDNPESLLTTGGLTELLSRVEKVISQWIDQDQKTAERRKSLRELLMDDCLNPDSLAFQAHLSLAKIEILLSVSGLDESLKTSLQTIKDFYETNLIPVFNLDKGQKTAITEKAARTLETPSGPEDNQESYRQKAERVLVKGKKQGGVQYKQPSRAPEKFHGDAKYDVLKMPARLSDELLKTATQINLIRILERLEEEGKIDFVVTRQKVQALLSSVPRRKDATFESLSPREAGWFHELNRQLAPIANAVAEQFPHDSVYLFSQMLEHKQAVCSGKASALVDIYKMLGLDARHTLVLVISGSKFAGSHAVCQINLPNDVILTVDSNWRATLDQSSFGLSGYRVFAGLLFSTGKNLEGDQLKEALDNVNSPHSLVVGRNHSCRQYQKVGSAHRLTSQSSVNYSHQPFNLAVLIENHPDLFVGVYGETEAEIRQHAGRLYQQVIETNPNHDSAMYNLAFLTTRHPYLFAQSQSDREQQLLRAKALLERHNRLVNNPDDPWVKLAAEKIALISRESKPVSA